eukprot:4868467-Heterocapsa_arctica.AAC.1
MGWSWSLHLAQRAHETSCVRHGLKPHDRIVDRHPTRLLTGESHIGSGLRHAVYVDNYLVLGHDPVLVQKSAALHASGLEREGLPTHEIESCVTNIDYVGLHFDGDSHE